MKILLINKFLYPRGGAETITIQTGRLLSKNGNQVYFWGMKHPENPPYPYSQYFVENVDYAENYSFIKKIKVSLKILYSLEAKRKIEKFINEVVKPDVVHLNNFAHQISPSILHVFKKYNIPTVMTMHDYKLVCPAYNMFNGKSPCKQCKGRAYFGCFLRKCVKNSFSKSLLSTIEMYLHHKILNIYDTINVFISPSHFLAEKFREMGFEKKFFILPNFVSFDGVNPRYGWEENSICYVGRLSKEKGVSTLIKAMKGVSAKLKIFGEGPEKRDLVSLVHRLSLDNVEFLGYLNSEDLYEAINKSKFIVLPSICYENNPRSALEAYALGKPIIGTKDSGIPVIDGHTGLTFEVSNVEDLREKIKFLLDHPQKIIEFGKNAREFVEKKHSQENYYNKLIRLYNIAMEKRKWKQR